MTKEDYAALLRELIGDSPGQQKSRRKLSFEMAAETGNRQESEYRSLGKYLEGKETPSPERGALLAVLLRRPELALVPQTRRDRRAELAKTVEQIEIALGGALSRIEALEAHAQQGRRRAAGGR